MPESILCQRTNRIKTIEELTEHIDLKKFVFEGLSIIKVNDVTEQEVISMIKNSLLNINAFSDATVYPELEAYIQSLLGLKDVRIGVTPFFKVNGHYVYSDLHNNNSILFKHFHSKEEKDEVSDGCKLVFKESDRPVVFENLTEQLLTEVDYLQYYYMEGGRSVIICPLKLKDELLGILEIMCEKPGSLRHTHISKITLVFLCLRLGLKKIFKCFNRFFTK